ncbi:hypothetical protein FVR03_02620 [Pontibacter qinzhouensis]|uniref:Uncharacterized protein n=1 Tax=Pontibacter qinzhouensis TaxID=2603253 RepID=A0A5C8KAQ1_9BACT|nr:hypothetical protein [Pontibacter qinzhouensis]TXK51993.1 hypothetical protein FVR03_02620 [Pontibacter qinzhouensis]
MNYLKNILCLGFLLLVISLKVEAQSTLGQPRQYFVQLRNGEVVYANKVQIKSPIFKSDYFLLDDSLQYNIEIVDTYQNNQGYFTRIAPGSNTDAFAKRISEGPRLSKFYSTRNYYNYGAYGYGMGMPGHSRRRLYYFSKDYGPLYEYNYNNLQQALSDNASSMALLKQYRRNKIIHTGMSIAGAGVLAYGAISSANSSQNGGVPSISPAVYGGAALIVTPFIIQLFQKDKLQQAMEVYNYEIRN